MAFRVSVLGGLVVERDGRPVEDLAAQRKALALLALLAVHGQRGLSRDKAMVYLWPDAASPQARNALGQLLYRLRRQLDPEAVRGNGELRLNDASLTTDIGDFRLALERGDFATAAAFYSGDLLDGFHLRDAPEFERWVDIERESTRQRYALALDRLIVSAQEQGDRGGAVRWLQKRVELEPLAGEFAFRYVEALVAAGNRAAAIRHADVHAALVRSELGYSPDDRVLALARQLRSTVEPAAFVAHDMSLVHAVASESKTASRDDLAEPTPTVGAGAKTLHRAPTRWRLVGSSIVAVATLGFLFTVRGEGKPTAPHTGALTRLTLGQAAEVDPSVSPDGKWIAFAASRTGQARASPTFQRILIQPVAGGRAIPVTADSTVDQREPTWSPDGSQIAFRTPNGLYVVAALGGTAERVLADSGNDLRLGGWSHDGKRIAYADARGIWVRDLRAGTAHLVTRAGFGAHAPVWSPDDSTIAFAVGTANAVNVAPSEILLVSAKGGIATPISDSVHLNTSPVFAPDGRGLFYVSNRDGGRDIYEQMLRGGRRPLGPPSRLTTGANAASVSISADGKTLVYGAEFMRSNIWSAPIQGNAPTPNRAFRQMTFGDQEVECVAVSRDGTWLVFDSNRHGNQDIYKMPVSGGDPIQLTTDPADDFCGKMSPDGREIAFYSFRPDGYRRAFTMLADGGRQRAVFGGGPDDQQWDPDWSPDGQRMAFPAKQGGVPRSLSRISVVRRAPDGSWADRRVITSIHGTVVRWSSDGQHLATVSDSGVTILSPDGSNVRLIVPRNEEDVPDGTFVVWGRDPSTLFYRTTDRHGNATIWSASIAGGRPRALLRLNDPVHPSRRIEFATNGSQLFFTRSADEASVWELQLSR